MASILEQLFHGEIKPDQRSPVRSARYREQADRFAQAEDAFLAHLSDEQKELFEAYQYVESEFRDYMELDRFICGFHLGMGMMTEALNISDQYMI